MAAYLLAVAILFCIQGWPSGTVQGQERPFLEVYERSVCQARETLVSLIEDYPEDFLRPACVAVLRCGGCCSDENLKCTPVKQRTVGLEVMLINPRSGSSKMEVKNVIEHTACECRPRSGSGVNIGKRQRSQRKGTREPSSPLSDPLFTPGAV